MVTSYDTINMSYDDHSYSRPSEPDPVVDEYGDAEDYDLRWNAEYQRNKEFCDGECVNEPCWSDPGWNITHNTCEDCDEMIRCGSSCFSETLCDSCCSNKPIQKFFECIDCHEKRSITTHCGAKLHYNDENRCYECNSAHQLRMQMERRRLMEQKKAARYARYRAKNGPYGKCVTCGREHRHVTLDKYDGVHCRRCFAKL